MTTSMAATTARPADDGADKWRRCRSCAATVYLPRLVRALSVCPECGAHERISAAERLDQVLDEGSFVPATDVVTSADPLEFVDTQPYPARLAKARAVTGLPDAVLRGRGRIKGIEIVVAAMDFRFIGASMGSAVGEEVTRAAEESLRGGCPLVLFVTSGGARMQEGALSLMQLAKTTQAVRRLGNSGIPSISVLTDPTFGGVTASFATIADFVLAEQGSLIGFAGPRVIEAATRVPLPAGFQTAEYLVEHGMLDRVVPRGGLRQLLGQLLGLARPSRPDEWGTVGDAGLVRDPELLAGTRGAARTLRIARDIDRPTTMDYLRAMCADFVELHGDRTHGDDRAIIGGLASIRGVRVVVIGHQKGHDTTELIANNFGMPHPEGYRKARRLMRLARRLRLPVVTFVDTQGAAPGIGAEERGQAWAIAEAIAEMAELPVPVVSIVTGEGGSGGALAIAVANSVLMLENACYSVISPESCSTILHGSPAQAEAMAEQLRITSADLLQLGLVDGVIPEPADGARFADGVTADAIASAVLTELAELSTLAPDELRAHRFARFRDLGVYFDG